METTVKLTERRKKALDRLKEQLQVGTKPNKPIPVEGKTLTQQKKDNPRIPLTEKDKERIKKEISVLESRLTFS